jgi:hypothetical protein
VGTFHAVAILTLTAFGVSKTDAGSYAIVMHATLWLPVTVIGFITFVLLGFGWGDFRTAQDEVHQAEHAPTSLSLSESPETQEALA